MPELNDISRKRLATCDDRLQRLVTAAAARSPFSILVVCGHRGFEEQEAAFAAGLSKLRWGQSRHNHSPSLAVDLAPLEGKQVPWNDMDRFDALGALVKDTAVDCGIRLTWGGDWKSFKDRPHFQVDALAGSVPAEDWAGIRYFNAAEFSGLAMDMGLIRELDRFREAVGAPVIIRETTGPRRFVAEIRG